MQYIRPSVAAVAGFLAGTAALTFSTAAFAQDPNYPEPPKPEVDETPDELAGVGSLVPYSESGTIEAGGSFGLTLTNGGTIINADPMIGYFLWDNIQVSGIVGVQWAAYDEGTTTSLISLVLEPSFHYPFTDRFFGFVGLGGGLAMSDDGSDLTDEGPGIAIAPRAGVQYLVGRSGLLNFGLRGVFAIVDVDADYNIYGTQGYLALTNNYSLQAGYTVMF